MLTVEGSGKHWDLPMIISTFTAQKGKYHSCTGVLLYEFVFLFLFFLFFKRMLRPQFAYILRPEQWLVMCAVMCKCVLMRDDIMSQHTQVRPRETLGITGGGLFVQTRCPTSSVRTLKVQDRHRIRTDIVYFPWAPKSILLQIEIYAYNAYCSLQLCRMSAKASVDLYR